MDLCGKWLCKTASSDITRFEFKILNDKKNVVVEQKSVWMAVNYYRTGFCISSRICSLQFRNSKSGHLALLWIMGKTSMLLLSFMIMWTMHLSKQINGTHSDISEPSGFPKRILMNWNWLQIKNTMSFAFIIFSETPFTKIFLFIGWWRRYFPSWVTEGYSELPSVTSQQFVQWLQTNRIRKRLCLQISIVDLIIDNH